MKPLLARLRLRHHPVLALIFVTGAAVLAIEVAATRLLAPSFGSTVFTVSSVISVVLGALSLGYYVGGRAADAYPAPRIFYGLILAAGLATFLILPGVSWVVPQIASNSDLLFGPLMAAFVLFFVPSALLGALSPLAVVLYQGQGEHRGTGRAAGSVSFWSTAGSIVGSLSTAFVFIPRVGLSVLVLGVGAMLVLIGGAGLVVSGVRRRKILKVLLVLPVLLAFSAADPSTAAGRLIYHHDGRYALIRIFDGVMPDGRPVRSLRIDDSSSAARYLDGNDLVYGYTRFADLLPVWRPDARKALVIGGGAYSVPEALVKQLPRASVDVAEIEPDLYSLSKQYFGVQDNPRLVNHVEDGRHFLHGKTGQYDLIFGDAYYSVSSIPQHLATREFFELAKSSLTDNGIYMMNVIGRLGAQQPSFTLSEIKTFRTVFPNGQVVAVNDPKSPEVQNLMFIGGKGVMPDLSSVASQTVDLGRYDLAPHRVFTDDFSPIDYYIATTVDFHS